MRKEEAIRTTVQLVVGERAALAASSGLINAAPDHPSKRFLAAQTLDEARHAESLTQRLYDLGMQEERTGGHDQLAGKSPLGEVCRDPARTGRNRSAEAETETRTQALCAGGGHGL